MTKKIIIRPACPDDYNTIIELFDSWYPDNWDSYYAKRYYRDFFDNPHFYLGDKVFVGIVDERIVGVTGYCPDPEETEGIYWLNWFYVHQDFIKHRYGGQLLDHVVEILKNKRARKFFVNTTSYGFYEKARNLYKAKGFEEEGVLKDFYEKGEHQVFFGMSLK